MMTPEQIKITRAVLDSHERTRQRLREAGLRAADAETMRAAAIAEMGTAIRAHRGVLAAHPSYTGDARIQMDDAQELTGVSRRTLSEAVGAEPERTDQQLAAEYRAYGYEDTDPNRRQLHARYPHLDCLRHAIRLLGRLEQQLFDAERGPAPLIEVMDDPAPEMSPQRHALVAEYRRQVDRIADGLPLADV